MPEDDDFRVWIRFVKGFGSRDAQLVAVDQQKIEALETGLDSLGDAAAQLKAIGISPDRCDRSQSLELAQEGRLADISGVEDPVDVPKDLKELRAQESVGVADDTYAHELGAGG